MDELGAFPSEGAMRIVGRADGVDARRPGRVWRLFAHRHVGGWLAAALIMVAISATERLATAVEPVADQAAEQAAEPKTESKTEPKTESKTEPKTESKTEPKTESKTESKTGSVATRPATTSEALLEKMLPRRSDSLADWSPPRLALHDAGEPRVLPPCVPPAPCHPAYPPQPFDLIGVAGAATCGPRYRGPCEPRLGTHAGSGCSRLHAVCDAAFDLFYR